MCPSSTCAIGHYDNVNYFSRAVALGILALRLASCHSPMKPSNSGGTSSADRGPRSSVPEPLEPLYPMLLHALTYALRMERTRKAYNSFGWRAHHFWSRVPRAGARRMRIVEAARRPQRYTTLETRAPTWFGFAIPSNLTPCGLEQKKSEFESK